MDSGDKDWVIVSQAEKDNAVKNEKKMGKVEAEKRENKYYENDLNKWAEDFDKAGEEKEESGAEKRKRNKKVLEKKNK